MNDKDNKILAIGVYLSDQTNNALTITNQLFQAQNWEVECHWVAIGHGEVPQQLMPITTVSLIRKNKFKLINELINKFRLSDYRYLLVTDDDIDLPEAFLDTYLGLQSKYGFALAQPARTHDSYIDHKFVTQLLGVEARRTRFVEIGPLFSVERQAYQLLTPFDQEAPMGWGLDFVWPVVLEDSGAKLGIIDGAPVTHALRKPVAFYDYTSTAHAMSEFLRSHRHLTREDAFLALETYPLGSSYSTPTDRYLCS